jgi:hypothetical protein
MQMYSIIVFTVYSSIFYYASVVGIEISGCAMLVATLILNIYFHMISIIHCA